MNDMRGCAVLKLPSELTINSTLTCSLDAALSFHLLLPVCPSFYLTETVMDTRTATAELGWISFPANGVRTLCRVALSVCVYVHVSLGEGFEYTYCAPLISLLKS